VLPDPPRETVDPRLEGAAQVEPDPPDPDPAVPETSPEAAVDPESTEPAPVEPPAIEITADGTAAVEVPPAEAAEPAEAALPTEAAEAAAVAVPLAEAAQPAAVAIPPDETAGTAAVAVPPDETAETAEAAEAAEPAAVEVLPAEPTGPPPDQPRRVRLHALRSRWRGDEKDAATAGEAEAIEHHRPWRTVARVAAWGAAIVAVAVVLLVFVFPTRTYLSQRHQLALTADELHLLDQQNAQLSAQVARLQTDAEIERIAREQYHLVRPGERAFGILPPSTPPTTAAPVRPAPAPSRDILHRLTDWIP
jgi:cell division protein FtsB